MTEVSTWGPRPLTRPQNRRGRLLLRHRLRLRLLARRLLALVAALALVGLTHLGPDPTANGRSNRSSSEGAGAEPASGEPARSGVGPEAPTADGQPADPRGPEGSGRWPGLGADERAVAIGTPLAPLPLEAGDRIELVGVAADGQGGVRAELLTGPVEVLSVSADAIVVAVPASIAPRVIEAQAAGAVEVLAVP